MSENNSQSVNHHNALASLHICIVVSPVHALLDTQIFRQHPGVNFIT